MKHYFISSLCVLLTMLIHGISFSQEGNVWTFGVGAKVDFGTALPTVSTSAISTYEGCASISDNTGSLIFYTDGVTVWDNTDAIVATGLNGNFSTAQSAIILPQPSTTPGLGTGNYYIFTVPELASGKVNFSIYSATLHTMLSINNPMPDDVTAINTTEGITAARHCNGVDYWVITHEAAGSNRFKAYQLTNTGVVSPVNTNIGPAVSASSGNIDACSSMKISPSNRRLAFMIHRSSVNLFDFNNTTGVISNQSTVAHIPAYVAAYSGVEFSPNSNILYYSDALTGLYAYEITTHATRTLTTVSGATDDVCASLQLAPNGKIYVAKDADSDLSHVTQTTLGRIDLPNNYALANYVAAGLTLASGTAVKCGLPNIVATLETPQCCFAATDSAYTHIDFDTTFTSYTVFSGKYYIAPGVIITVDGTTLDLTNVDMVFDQCAGINFIRSAEVLAYNSVFRTCDETKSWLGFYFSSSSGNISESTFKNAQKAIRLEKGSSVRITNNNFLNDQIAIYVFDNTQNEAISGNEFTIDNVPVDYHFCNNTFANGGATGIWASQATFNDVISQNTFVNADYSNTKKVYGLFLTEFTSGANISANSFTNQFVSIYAAQSSFLSIENNTVELTNLYTYPGTAAQDIQFYFPKETNNVTVTGNTLKGRPDYSNYGIYCDGNDRMYLSGNELKDFRSAIFAKNSTNIDAISNSVENTYTGIYFSDCPNSYIGCNVINCMKDNSSGIALDQNNSNNIGCKIVGNCIYNSDIAMSLANSTSSGVHTLPYIANNFLYSYRTYGIINANFNGDIGSGLSGLTAGKNTFTSNNVAGGAVDIISTTPLTSYGNYGITSIGGGITLVGSNTFYSTASCGNQLGNATTEFSPDDLCQTKTQEQLIVNKLVSEDGILLNGFETELENLGSESKFLVLKNISAQIASDNTTNDMTAVHNIVSDLEISGNEKLWILSQLYRKQPAVALTYLQSIEGEEDLVSIEKTNLFTLTATMTSEQFDELNIIQESPSEYREKAREALNVYNGDFPYRLELKSSNTTGAAGQNNTISVSQNNLTIFPNPAAGIVSFQVSIPSNEKSTLVVTDLSGKIIENSEITEDFKVIDLDISSLRNGMYIVNILQEGKLLLTNKLCVLH